jgi:UDPglucose 6-dehydrogenase
LCERVGADVKEVSKGMGLDNRIGNKFLHAGPGYGGSCFPKDTRALARIGQEAAVPMQIVETVIKVNEEVKRRMIDKIVDLCEGTLNGRTIAVLGRDLQAEHRRHARGAVADHRARARRRRRQGARGRSARPARGRDAAARRAWHDDPYKAAQNADAVVILTEWNEFRALDLKRLARKMATPRLADLRNVYSARDAKRAGFSTYESIGR